jgi:hypothetical protein
MGGKNNDNLNESLFFTYYDVLNNPADSPWIYLLLMTHSLIPD